ATLLLALLTGYPSQATEILRVLTEEEPSGNWWQFVSSYKARVLGSSVSPVRKKLKQSMRPSEAGSSSAEAVEGETLVEPRTDRASWVEVFDKLDKVKSLVPDRPCKQFAEWAPRVARYSFQSGDRKSTRLNSS